MNHVTEKKLNNKGFSLVELIIVIAIMAVLVGVLAPQYLKYVEKSRVSSDRDNVDAIVSALQVYAVDPDATSTFTNGQKVEITRTSTTPNTEDAAATGAVVDALKSAGLKTKNLKLTNKQTFQKVEIVISVDANNKVTVTPTETP